MSKQLLATLEKIAPSFATLRLEIPQAPTITFTHEPTGATVNYFSNVFLRYPNSSQIAYMLGYLELKQKGMPLEHIIITEIIRIAEDHKPIDAGSFIMSIKKIQEEVKDKLDISILAAPIRNVQEKKLVDELNSRMDIAYAPQSENSIYIADTFLALKELGIDTSMLSLNFDLATYCAHGYTVEKYRYSEYSDVKVIDSNSQNEVYSLWIDVAYVEGIMARPLVFIESIYPASLDILKTYSPQEYLKNRLTAEQFSALMLQPYFAKGFYKGIWEAEIIRHQPI